MEFTLTILKKGLHLISSFYFTRGHLKPFKINYSFSFVIVTSVLFAFFTACEKDPLVTPTSPETNVWSSVLPDSVLMTTSYSNIVPPFYVDTVRYYYTYSGGLLQTIQKKGRRFEEDWTNTSTLVDSINLTYQFVYNGNEMTITMDSAGTVKRQSVFHFSCSYTNPEYLLEYDPVSGALTDSFSFSYNTSGFLTQWTRYKGVSSEIHSNTVINNNVKSFSGMMFTNSLSPVSQNVGFNYFKPELASTTFQPMYIEDPAQFGLGTFRPSEHLIDSYISDWDSYTYTFTPNGSLSEIYYENNEHDTWRVKIKLY